MASYNNFKTNIYKYSWFMCLGHLGVIIGIACISIFLKYFMQNIGIPKTYPHYGEFTDFVTVPFALTFLEWPNFWTLIFLTILGLGSLNILVIQLFSLLTSLYDEYENLRDIKKHALFGTVAILLVTSILFCSNHGIFFFETLSKFSAITQVILNLLLLLVVLWVYGRERFQRDVYFMISQTYSTWMVFVVRFVAPLFLISGVIIGFILSVVSLLFHNDTLASGIVFLFITIIFFLLAWCLIPLYCIIKIKATVGKIGIRLKRCVRPTDWYPADPEYKQSYEERFSTTDMSHQLTIVSEEENN
ncbi:sodium-dependent proline transporter-like isoform X2 [Eupeodes corollae]|nr:sodium-dependent proline transporter-like isoform X2 [Eupeodes corollae]